MKKNKKFEKLFPRHFRVTSVSKTSSVNVQRKVVHEDSFLKQRQKANRKWPIYRHQLNARSREQSVITGSSRFRAQSSFQDLLKCEKLERAINIPHVVTN
ncbi:hypothetical protein OS493_008653 [Desmophyllum pertusum]|uniref:Uncharacterized protein n=1 Tax=Desmophyllum pertusum TaxID=174260 RepID=A0A9X0D417_9CNID|nr:hypothetical protein OS493_008653 [Desmophyllum pertusum]